MLGERISHALLVDDNEARLGSGEDELQLQRARSTALRGSIALARSDGHVFGRGVIDSVEVVRGPAGRRTVYQWRIRDVHLFEKPIDLEARILGPVWVRLGANHRVFLDGARVADRLPRVATTSAKPALGDEGGDLPTAASATTDEVEESAPATAEVELGASELTAAEPADGGELTLLAAGEAAAEPVLDGQGETEDAPEFERPQEVAAAGQNAALPPAGRTDEALRFSPNAVEEQDDARREERQLALVAAAHERARGFVPSGPISEDRARRILVDLRELEIKPTFPHVNSAAGILRKTLLDRLLGEPIESIEGFERLIPRDVRAATDKDQIAAYLDPIIEVLKAIR